MEHVDFSHAKLVNEYKQKFPKKSYGEIEVKIFLDNNNIEYLEEVDATITYNTQIFNIRVDFYIPKYNVVIEYNGEQHYKPVHKFGGIVSFLKQQSRDEMLRISCKNNNITLIEIPYNDFFNKYFDQILKICK